MTLTPQATSRLYLLAGAALWSSGGFFIKEIDAGATSITMFRCLFTAALLAPFMRVRTLPRAGDTVVSVVLFALLLGLYVGSTKSTTAANAIFLQYTAPLYVIAFAPLLLGESLRSRDAVPVAICIAGIAVLVLGNLNADDSKGLLMGAGSGLFYGLFLIWLRRLRYADPVAVTLLNCAGVALIFAFFPGAWDVGSADLLLLLIMAAFQFALPYVLFTRGLRHVTGSEASLIALIEPVLNPVWVALFYGENPALATIIGGAVIVLGLALRYAVFRDPIVQTPT